MKARPILRYDDLKALITEYADLIDMAGLLPDPKFNRLIADHRRMSEAIRNAQHFNERLTAENERQKARLEEAEALLRKIDAELAAEDLPTEDIDAYFAGRKANGE